MTTELKQFTSRLTSRLTSHLTSHLPSAVFITCAAANMAFAIWGFAARGTVESTVLLWVFVSLLAAQMAVLRRQFVEVIEADRKVLEDLQTAVGRAVAEVDRLAEREETR